MTDTPSAPPGPSGRMARIMPGLAALMHYQRAWLSRDVAAGLSVAAVALPVGIAYADIAGVPAVVGMYAAIFPLFAYALFGSSRQLMTGPDAATCMMAAAILAPLADGDAGRYQALMVVLTLCTGLLYIVAGFARLGFIANFLSLPILAGFLNGTALIIIVGQLPKLLGYSSDADEFSGKVVELLTSLDQINPPTAVLGAGLLVGLVLLRRLVPRLPNPLLIVIAGIALVAGLGLDDQGVAILGTVPSGLPPAFEMPKLDLGELKAVLRDASALVLVSFTSGMLTAKSFAQRNHYSLDANQELRAFGAANLASGLAQGFPVTGADSRTAVNDAMGGKTQLVGVVAAGAMLLILFFLTGPLALVPSAALAAVIVVSAAGLIDIGTLKGLFGASRAEFLFSVGTTLGVLFLGILPGVLLAVILSIVMLLALASNPPVAVLGRIPGARGFYDVAASPDARTVPGLLLFRFSAGVVFFNADRFKQSILDAIDAAEDPVEWVVVDLSPVNVVDITAVRAFDDLRQQLADRGIVLGTARGQSTAVRRFDADWMRAHLELNKAFEFPTLRSAMRAFEDRKQAPESSP